jgi:glycosyltransferase involved in cell wall biosynthesis
LFSAISKVENRGVRITLFAGTEVSQSILDNFKDVEVIRSSFLNYRSPHAILRKSLKALFFGRDIILRVILYLNGIQILSHSGNICFPGKIKTIGWIPDFQHIHLPFFFSAKEIVKRNIKYQEWLYECDLVIFSSSSAQKDSEILSKNFKIKSRILHFLPETPPDLVSNFALFKEKYQIPDLFFYVPNQFWAHKNHIIILEALKILNSENIRVVVITTGSINDNRSQDHIDNIKTKLIDYCLQEQFRMLGVVPYATVIDLIKNCQAVINPSFFEGWSSSVEEGKMLDKVVILSDIPVHREQNPHHGRYFDPKNAQELADIIKQIQNNESGNQGSGGRLVNGYEGKRMNFAYQYLNIIKELV